MAPERSTSGSRATTRGALIVPLLVCCWAASLVDAGTREVQSLLLRAHLGVPGAVEAGGQGGGCVIERVPHTRLSEAGVAALAESAKTSPEDWLLVAVMRPAEAPPPPDFRTQPAGPVLLYAALAAVSLIDGVDFLPRQTSSDDLERRVRPLVERAILMEPQNGLPLVALANVELRESHFDEAEQLLRRAASLKRFDFDNAALVHFLTLRLESLGMSSLDAWAEVPGQLRYLLDGAKLSRLAAGPMAAAMARGDAAALKRWAEVFLELEPAAMVAGEPMLKRGWLLGALQPHLEPRATPELREATRAALLGRIEGLLGPELTHQLEAPIVRYPHRPSEKESSAEMRRYFLSRSRGMAALMLMGLLLTALFALSVTALPHRKAVAIPIAILTTAIMFRTSFLTLRPVGFRVIGDGPGIADLFNRYGLGMLWGVLLVVGAFNWTKLFRIVLIPVAVAALLGEVWFAHSAAVARAEELAALHAALGY